MNVSQRSYGVDLVRGPVVSVTPHTAAVRTTEDLRRWVSSLRPGRPLAADLFCGAGGLSLGLGRAGYEVVVGIDSDTVALATYAGLHSGLALCRDLSNREALDDTVHLLAELNVEVIAGGPPCQPFSRAGASKIRHLVEAGQRPELDERRDLWRCFLEIVLRVQPAAVLLENVPDMATAPDSTIVRSLVNELEAVGYGVHTGLLRACDHGIPQFRQRFFLVALAGGLRFDWPLPSQTQVTVRDAIGDLPPVAGGWRPTEGAAGFIDYEIPTLASAFARRAREGLSAADRGRVYDHITRPVRDDDRVIFESMDSKTRYSEIDRSLRRYRADIFDDKYKRLDWDRPSRSITAHIARDGYWYIHPEQTRTLTVREAARLQTFPDGVRFAGPPSSAFRQIGNAVPPSLAERVARSIRRALRDGSKGGPATSDLSDQLVSWFEHKRELVLPWLEAPTAWAALQGHMLLDRASQRSVQTAWPTLEKLDDPERTIESEDQVHDLADLIGRGKRSIQVLEAARWFARNPDAFDTAAAISEAPGVTSLSACISALVDPRMGPTPTVVSQRTLRVASRVFGLPQPMPRPGTEGRLAVVRLLGGPSATGRDDSRTAMAAVLELAADLCAPKNPRCSQCPLRGQCQWSQDQMARQR